MERRVVAVSIGMILILLTSIPMNLDCQMENDPSTASVIGLRDNAVPSYTPHAGIQTHGDTELYNLAIAEMWPGYGNITHPWIIEGYSITDWRPIHIGFTSYIFTIRDCLITGTDPNLEYGIRILGTDYTRIENCIISNAGEGIEFWDVQYSTIENCTIYGCGSFGVYLRYALYCNILDCEVRDNPQVGINVHESHHMTLEDNIVDNNGREGILVSHETSWTSDYLAMENNTIMNNGGSSYPGLSIQDTHYVTATDMAIYSNYVGVLVEDSNELSFTDSRVFQNSESGVHISSSDSGTFRNNTLSFNGDSGLMLANSDDWTVTENLVHDNGGHGFELLDTSNSLLYYNDIGWNGLSNANDTGSGANDWNTADTGNWWHDYTGGVYDIPGGAIDNYPSYSLVGESNGPMNVQWESVDDFVYWDCNARNPYSYEVYRNESLVASGLWDGSDIGVFVNASEMGFYEYKVIAFHDSGHNATKSTNATVGDWRGPDWVFTPQDVILLVGIDMFYQLLAEDQSGVGVWNVNDTVNFAISTSGLITNKVSLDIGTYGLNISVYDVLGNVRYISIRVIVIEEIPTTTVPTTTTTTTTTTLPTTTTTDGDITPFIMTGMFGALGGGLLVGLIALASRRRGGDSG